MFSLSEYILFGGWKRKVSTEYKSGGSTSSASKRNKKGKLDN